MHVLQMYVALSGMVQFQTQQYLVLCAKLPPVLMGICDEVRTTGNYIIKCRYERCVNSRTLTKSFRAHACMTKPKVVCQNLQN